MGQDFRGSIINYEFWKNRTLLRGLNKSSTANSYNYLMITYSDSFKQAIEPLAYWERRKGLKTKIIQVSNNETTIKDSIKNAYDNYNIDYVLLVGDEADLTMSSNGPGDFWYSDLYWEGDSLTEPEVLIGRVSAKNTSEVNHFVRKSIHYETDPPDNSWVGRSLLVAHKYKPTEQYQKCKEDIKDATYTYGSPTFYTAYGADLEGVYNSTVTNYIENGVSIVNYRGHGLYNCWSDWNLENEDYTTSDARNLENGDMTPIVFSIACLTSKLDESGDCLGEAFLKADDAAVAFLGCTRSNFRDPNHTCDKFLYKAIFDSGYYDLGSIFSVAVTKMIDQHGVNGKANAKYYLWLGDPALNVWTNTLSQFTSVTITDYTDSIKVDSNVSGSTICICSDNSSYHKVETNTEEKTFTGISSSDRPLYITVTKHNYIPYTVVTGGTFTNNTAWFGNLRILGNITVNSGKELRIISGATLKFNNYKKITSYGVIDADGEASKPIKFTSNSGSNNWYGIELSGSGATNSELEYCTIEKVLSYGGSALKILNCSPTIENCTVKDNQNYGTTGIYVYNGSPKLYNNTITNNASCGIYLNSSNGYIYCNSIYSNSSYGINCYYYSSPSFGKVGSYPGDNNNIYSNSYGVRVNNHSNPVIGTQGSSYYRNNCLHNNTNYNCHVTSTSTVLAEYVWWGENPPDDDKIYKDGSSYLYYNPYLTSDPMTKEAVPLLIQAIQLRVEGKYTEAFNLCQKIINDTPGSSEAEGALAELLNLFRETSNTNIVNFCSEIRNNQSVLNAGATVALWKMKMCEGDYSTALNLNSEYLTDSPRGENELFALVDKLYIYLYGLEDYQNAKSVFEELQLKYPDDINTKVAEMIIANGDPKIHIGDKKVDDSSSGEIIELKQNYPNPGNPTTTIEFRIAKESPVVLKVFNILGQEVISLVDETKQAGLYNIIWDGKNSCGNVMSSGVYIYMLKVGDKVMTRKLTLIK